MQHDGALQVRPGRRDAPDCVLEVGAEDLVHVLMHRADPVEMFYRGRLRILGNVALAMQVASALSD